MRYYMVLYHMLFYSTLLYYILYHTILYHTNDIILYHLSLCTVFFSALRISRVSVL